MLKRRRGKASCEDGEVDDPSKLKVAPGVDATARVERLGREGPSEHGREADSLGKGVVIRLNISVLFVYYLNTTIYFYLYKPRINAIVSLC